MVYHAGLLVSSATCAAWLRRHLMVWKIFAPRFMLAAVTVVEAVEAQRHPRSNCELPLLADPLDFEKRYKMMSGRFPFEE